MAEYRELGKDEVVGPGEKWVTVTHGMSGWFAVVMWVNNEGDEPFPEPYDTGLGRYADRQSAVDEGMRIAFDEQLPYQFDGVVS